MPNMFDTISEIQVFLQSNTPPLHALECGASCSCIDCDSLQPALLPVFTEFPLLVSSQILTGSIKITVCGM
jgi:hypothetical protein